MHPQKPRQLEGGQITQKESHTNTSHMQQQTRQVDEHVVIIIQQSNNATQHTMQLSHARGSGGQNNYNNGNRPKHTQHVKSTHRPHPCSPATQPQRRTAMTVASVNTAAASAATAAAARCCSTCGATGPPGDTRRQGQSHTVSTPSVYMPSHTCAVASANLRSASAAAEAASADRFCSVSWSRPRAEGKC